MDPAILLIIIFIVAPLLERLLKAGKQTPPPTQQRLPQRPQQRLPHEQQPEEWEADEQEQQASGYRAESRGDPAAEMLPDDLWEILTGERRPPQRPGPRPAPDAGHPDESDYSLEEARSLEGRSLEDEALRQASPPEVQSSREWSMEPDTIEVVLPAEPYIRPNPVRLAPKVVSLEEIDFDYEQRHDEFHDMLDSLDGPARVKRPALSAYRFKSKDDLRRSIVMAEILGTPRGLE